MSNFNEIVLQWLQQRVQATSVIDVRAHGTDWAGGTEEGFYEQFKVGIYYYTGVLESPTCYDVAGEELESLWKFVVGWIEAP